RVWTNNEKRKLNEISRRVADALTAALAFKELGESEERLREFMQSATDGFSIWDSDLNLVEINLAGISLLSPGTDRLSLVGRNMSEVAPILIPPDGLELYRDVLEYGAPASIDDFVPDPRDGNRHFSLKAFRVRKGLGVVFSDITERKIMEQQSLQTYKMEAVGRLAGGLAHDFNNILTAIIGNLELLSLQFAGEGTLPAELDEIRSASNKAANLTEQLLAFSRKQIIAPKVIDLNEIVENMKSMLRRLIREDVEIETSLELDLPCIEADPTQMQQVILNLALNARDAMPTGGKLTIATKTATLAGKYEMGEPSQGASPYVLLEIADTGEGISSETRSHLFEPFFTTKGIGRGTGLGLSAVYGIVEQSKGHITVESGEDHPGSRFKVYFPAVKGKAARTRAEGVSRASFEGNMETVLVVEDNDAVRGLVNRVLSRAGYDVLSASSADDAIEIYKERGESIALLLTDVIMPGMGGRDLARELEKDNRSLRTLFMSGYSEEEIAHMGVLDKDLELIGKPFNPEDLLKRIRAILDR
ncbi:MAG: response regulator, partial [Candidatus Coatesbacteria bacterium]|nr:response regulator [Candidatus Coatesbacteria bacterium]